MKKVMSVVLVLVMVLSLAACAAAPESAESKVASYVEKYGSSLVSGLEEAFATSSGMTCESSVKAEGTGIIIDIKINELDNLTQEQKDLMQGAYDAMGSSFDVTLTTVQKEISEVTYMTINVCEKDGDVVATIQSGQK